MSGPVIGLSTYCEPARWGPWHEEAVLLPANYAEEVAAAGGTPVLLPPVPGVTQALRRLDGLVLTGGGDLDPACYGAAPDPHTGRVSSQRDSAEFEILRAATAAGLPVLGICRGLQVLNVARGGTLCQHLPEDGGHTPAPGTFGSHPVRLAPGTRLAAVLGVNGNGGTLDVPTAHHQAIDRLGDGLVATAWAQDGTIEAVEPADTDSFLLAVQWHPEAGPDPRLVQALVRAATAVMAS